MQVDAMYLSMGHFFDLMVQIVNMLILILIFVNVKRLRVLKEKEQKK